MICVVQICFVSLDSEIKVESTILWYLIHKSLPLQKYLLKRTHWQYMGRSIYTFPAQQAE